jgi:hypothetical protein
MSRRCSTCFGDSGVLHLAACAPDDHRLSSLPTEAAATVRQRGRRSHCLAVLAAVRSGNARRGIRAGARLPGPCLPRSSRPTVRHRLRAMHDALNAIVPRFARYADALDPSANAVAAVLTAAHDALIGGVPGAQRRWTRGTPRWPRWAARPGSRRGRAGARVVAATRATRQRRYRGGGVSPTCRGSAPAITSSLSLQHARLRLRHGGLPTASCGDHGDPVRRAVDRAVPRALPYGASSTRPPCRPNATCATTTK